MKNRKIGKRFMALTLSMVMMVPAPVAYAKEGLGTEEPGIEVHAESKAADENGFEIKDGVLTKYKGNAAEVVIPDSVTSIGNYAFYQCTSLKSITIPDSVTSIENFAFNSCTSLESITIPDGVTSIGNYAFSSCSSLKNITIPGSVTSIGSRAFSGCGSLNSILVEPGNSVYDSRNNCNAIINTKINEMIAGCKNTVIPDSVASIGEGVFSSCSFESIIIPDSVTSIGVDAFSSCKSLKNITIPDSVTSIGYGAFIGCSSLESITIPNGVTSIEYGTFFDCTSLKSITILETCVLLGRK